MRIFTASMIGRLVLISLIFPVTATLATVEINQTDKNENENIIAISQGNLEVAQNVGKDRKTLSLDEGSLKTVKEAGLEKANKTKLEHYKSRLDTYHPPKGEVSILVTGYSSTPDQTWGNPFITASGTHVHQGTMACPPHYPFGTKVKIESMGTYVCEDRGGMIKGNHFDMWFDSRIKALNWGKRIVSAEIVK
ncbi:MAG: 3D domain-containing protein [Patescibacteria group bacterium]|nr:3D domain-containing protein [Patescibacteria group bacterium]